MVCRRNSHLLKKIKGLINNVNECHRKYNKTINIARVTIVHEVSTTRQEVEYGLYIISVWCLYSSFMLFNDCVIQPRYLSISQNEQLKWQTDH